MVKKRRLTDLFVVGRELEIDDGRGESVKVWLQKLNPVEAADAARRADAARARSLSVRTRPESDDYQAVRNAVYDYGDRAAVVTYLLAEDMAKAQAAREAELADAEEWKKDNYLQGLRDAWEPPEGSGLAEAYAADPENAEASRAHDELKRFADEAAEMVESEIAPMRDALMAQDEEELRDQMTEKLVETEANQAWLDEYYRCQVYFGTRDPDKRKERYFEGRSEVDDLAADAYRILRAAYQELEVEVSEGKDSQPPQDSSSSSEPPAEEATEASSGPADAAA